MDDIVQRLWDLANLEGISDGGSRKEIIIESQALWRTLETLLGTCKNSEFFIGDVRFQRTLACLRIVLVQPEDWRMTSQGDGEEKGVYIFSTRVLNMIACRGEKERDTIVREGFVNLLVQSMKSDQGIQHYQSSITCCASVLKLFQTLAFDARNRHLLDLAMTVPLSLNLMQTHPKENIIQLLACKFLQYMAYEEESKQHILEFEGLRIILEALRKFPQDSQLVVSATDLIYFLSMELENITTGTGAVIQEILETMIIVMRLHPNHEQIQTHGISIMNSCIFDPSIRCFLCTKENILEIIINLLNVHEEEAINDAINLLLQILTHEDSYETLLVYSTSNLFDTCTNYVEAYKQKLLDTIETLSSKVSAQKNTNDKVKEVMLIEEKLRSLHHEVETFQSTASSPDKRKEEEEEEAFTTLNTSSSNFSKHDSDTEGEETNDTKRAVDSEEEREEKNPHATPFLHDWEKAECPLNISIFGEGISSASSTSMTTSSQRLSHKEDETIPKAPQVVAAAENAMNTTLPAKAVTTTTATATIASSEKWRQRYETTVLELSYLKKDHHLLNENYKMIQRRCQEQSKLLNLQNARLKTHMEVHTQVLERMKKMEISLQEMTRKHQVERELRLAELLQSEKVSLSLHEAMIEIKALNAQSQAAAITTTTTTTTRTETKTKESFENLLMKEEDLNVCTFTSSSSLRPLWKNQIDGYVLKSCSSQQTAATINATDAATTKRQQRSQSVVISQALANNNINNHLVSFLRRPTSPIGDSGTVGCFSFNGGNDLEFQVDTTLRQIFETLDTSMDENGQTGVHFVVVRRFFQDVGLVQPPLMEGDLDTLLAKVLMAGGSSHNGSRRRSSFTTTSSSTASMVLESTKRHSRFFDPETFNAAVIAVGMRRFPRLEMRQILQVMMSQYFRPYTSSRKPHANVPIRSASVIYTPSSSNFSFSPCSSSIYRPSRSGSISFSNGSFIVPNALTSSSVLCMNAIRSILYNLHLNHEQQKQEGGGSSDFFMNRSNSDSSKNGMIVSCLLEMHGILSREQKPLSTLCEFYTQNNCVSNFGGTSITPTLPTVTTVTESTRDDIILGFSFDTILAFALDFELIPAFMDRLTLKRIYSEVTTLMKNYLNQYKKLPYINDVDTLKKVSFTLLIARIAFEIFCTKREYDTPEKQITGLLQWMDTCAGRDKVIKKSLLPMVIRFSTKLYTLKINN